MRDNKNGKNNPRKTKPEWGIVGNQNRFRIRLNRQDWRYDAFDNIQLRMQLSLSVKIRPQPIEKEKTIEIRS